MVCGQAAWGDADMTDFSNVRIPATRSGSGIVERTTPSGRHEIGQAVARIAVQRLRRHVDKGTTDLWPSLPPGQEVINEVTSWDPSKTGLFNVWCVTTNGAAVSSSLCQPNKLGQLLLLCLNEQLNGAYEALWDSSACLPPTSFVDGTTSYTTIELNNEGDNVLLIGLEMTGALTWFVVDNNGGLLY